MRYTFGFGSPTGRRRWRRGALVAVAAAVALLVMAPYLLCSPPLANMCLRIVPHRIQGTVAVGGISLGWFSPPEVESLEISPHDEPPLVTVPAVRCDLPLWKLAWRRSDLGHVRVERPQVALVITGEGSNAQQVFGIWQPRRASEPGDAPGGGPRHPPKRKVDLEIVDASVSWQHAGDKQVWTVEGINLRMGVRPAWASQRGAAELAVARGKVLDHCRISPGMCNDVLKYAAPVLNRITTARGEFSLELEDGWLSAEKPQEGQLGGRLSLHSVDVGPGPLIERLAEALHVPPQLRLANESVVVFELADGRVHHEGLEFGLPNVSVSTSGSVGLDHSLDLVAEIRLRFSDELTGKLPSLQALKDKPLRVPIKGTLSKPLIDARFFTEGGLANLFDTLDRLGLRRKGAATPSGTDSGTTAAGEGQPLIPPEATAALENVLRKWGERREQKRERADSGHPATADEPAANGGTDDVGESAPGRPLNRLRERRRRRN